MHACGIFRRRNLTYFLFPLLPLSVFALVVGALNGCGHGSQKVLYALGLNTPEVVLFQVSGAGTLSNPGSAASTGPNPDAMVIDPQFRFAYVADSTNGIGKGAISQYTLKASTGALSIATLPAINGVSGTALPVPTGVNPVALAVDAKGTFVFAANKGSDDISVYTIDQNTGALTPLGCSEGQSCTTQTFFSTAAGPAALASTGSFLFVANSGAAVLSTFSFDSSGNLTPTGGTTVAAGLSPVVMDMDSTGKFLFVAGSDSVASFSIGSSGQLTPNGAPVSAGTTPVGIRLHPTGKFLYTTNQGSNDISLFSVSSSGALSSGGTFPAGAAPSAVEIDASGKLLFVANRSANTISVFTVDTSSGKLQEVSGSPFPSLATTPVALKSLN